MTLKDFDYVKKRHTYKYRVVPIKSEEEAIALFELLTRHNLVVERKKKRIFILINTNY